MGAVSLPHKLVRFQKEPREEWWYRVDPGLASDSLCANVLTILHRYHLFILLLPVHQRVASMRVCTPHVCQVLMSARRGHQNPGTAVWVLGVTAGFQNGQRPSPLSHLCSPEAPASVNCTDGSSTLSNLLLPSTMWILGVTLRSSALGPHVCLPDEPAVCL